jgi:hypothetical protein
MARLALLGFVCAVALAAQAGAHHSYAMYDMQAERMIEGRVERVDWVNPHVLIVLRASEAGQSGTWRIEGHAPVRFEGNGFRRGTLKAGDQAQVVFHPLREGSGGSLVSLTLSDGRTFDRFGAPALSE